MPRIFKTADYEATLDLKVSLREALPPDHLARFVVDLVAQLDLSRFYARYSLCGGQPYAPEILFALLLYGYCTGVFSSRKIERATCDWLPFRFLAGDWHPGHDTIANFRRSFLVEIKELFVEVLLLAQEFGVLKLGNLSLDGSKVHADASKSKAVSYKRLLEMEVTIKREVEELFRLAEVAEQAELPEGVSVEEEIKFRQGRLERLAKAKAALEERAQERYQAELAAYQEKLRERERKAQDSGRKPGGRPPQPPQPGPHEKDQYNFTDPRSRVMKNSTDDGFNQHYNAQVAVDQKSLLIVANAVSQAANDKQQAVPTVEAIDRRVGKPEAVALDNGYFSEKNIEELEARKIEPYIATGRESHHRSWQDHFAQQAEPPPAEASAKEKMAYKLQTEIGKAIYGLRKCTVEPVIGIIKEVLGFRQFSLRGLVGAAGEWCLVCLAFNVKRLHGVLG
ncbi:MAG: IS1182 family transposase [Blastocatellia bacterium]